MKREIAEFREQVSELSAGESREAETFRSFTPIADSSVEMGSYYYGFCL